MEILSKLLVLYEGNHSLPTGEFPSKGLVMQTFDVYFDVSLDELLDKQ